LVHVTLSSRLLNVSAHGCFLAISSSNATAHSSCCFACGGGRVSRGYARVRERACARGV